MAKHEVRRIPAANREDRHCRFYTRDHLCVIGSCLANRPVEPWSGVCETCLKNAKPSSLNNVTASIACKSWSLLGRHDIADRLYRRYAALGLFAIVIKDSELPAPMRPSRCGAGAVLSWILHRFGFEVKEDCQCMFYAREMNRAGLRWTMRHSSEIAASMVREYRKRYPVTGMNSGLRDAMLQRVATGLVYFACAWRLLISSRLPC